MIELRLQCPKCRRHSLVASTMMYDASEKVMTLIFKCCTFFSSVQAPCPVVVRFEGRGFREDYEG